MLAMTGASGFIGSFLQDYLEHPIKILKRKKLSEEPSEVIQGDLNSPADAARFVAGAETLIHLACSSNPRYSFTTDDLEQNLIPTIRLFEAFAKHNPNGHIIYASTGGNMYCDCTGNFPKREEDLPMPRSGYAIHKLAAEHYLRLIALSFGVRATILRITNPYGTLLNKNRTQGLIGIAFSKLLAGEPMTIFDPKETLRDYIHLEDVANGFDKVLKSPPRNGETRLFHVSSAKGYTIHEVLTAIEELMDRKFKLIYAPESYTKAPSTSILSYEKLKTELGWEPKISLQEGLNRMKEQVASLSYKFQPL